jgi:hypothetical protein
VVDVPGVPLLSPLTAIVAVCALLAWAIVRGWWSPRWPFYRPVAWLLTWWLAFSTARATLQHFILRPARAALGEAPYPWPVRGAFLADLALLLSWPAALLGAYLAVFLRHRPWLAAVVWLLSWSAIAALYPALRGRPLLLVEAAIATACWLVCAWSAWRSFAAGDVWIASHMALVPILGAQLGVIVSVAWGADPVADWPIARLVQGVGYVLLIAYEVKQILKGRVGTR